MVTLGHGNHRCIAVVNKIKSMDSCFHGEWINGMCLCETGYESLFDEDILNPVYCGERKSILSNSLKPAIIFHLLTMSLTAALVASSSVGALLSVFHIWCLHSLASKINEVGQKLCDTHQHKLRRDSNFSLTATIWVPPSNFIIALPEKESLADSENKSEPLNYCAKILHCYTPQTNGELCLQEVGEIITNVVLLQRGWCKGILRGKKGFFPEAYVEILKTSNTSEEEK